MKQSRIFIAGAGHIGRTIAHILAQSKNYQIVLSDLKIAQPSAALPSNIKTLEIDINDNVAIEKFLKANPVDAFVTCLPHFLTIRVAELAAQFNAFYFDLTEDVKAGVRIKELAKSSKRAFTPHCGLAPGFINVVANDLIKEFEQVDEVKLRCGALPQSSSNVLQYALTWSTDGLINEYANPCLQLVDAEITTVSALEDFEEIQIDGANYEAFNTSGGIATLIHTYRGQVKTMNYKTIRYPGHGEKMRFLMRGLKLDHDRDNLKKILENALPTTKDDVVIVYVAVVGKKENSHQRSAFVHKYYPALVAGIECSAIQATTASGASAIIDTVLTNPDDYHGFVRQEDFTLEQVMNNRFGSYLKV